MGVVYQAVHEPLNRRVALKLMSADLSADENFRARFQVECRAAASIRHPNVVPIYHAGEEQGRLFVTMQYVDGADLGRVLALEERLDPGRAVGLLADLADGIDAAHHLGIVHRDVKPANVLIELHGTTMHPFLTDFGLAKHAASAARMTRTGAILGTLDYAAPEQLEETAIDARTDVYALGCLLFHTLTGRVPFPRETEAGTILAHLSAPPPPVTSLAPDVPAALARVVARAMAKDPAERYPSAGELGREALAAVGAPPRPGTAAPPAPATATADPDAEPTITIGPGAAARLRGAARAPRPPRPARDGAFPAALTGDERRTPFVGRRPVIGRLDRRYALAGAAQPQFVVLAGEPGVGKTRLAAEFARRVHGEGAIVLYGRSDPESIVPYQPFITAMQQYLAHYDSSALAEELDLELGELGRFIPGLRRDVPTLVEPLAVEPEARRYRLFEAVARVLAFIAAERPVVLILDDLHWADTSTALLLRHVVQQCHDVALMLLGTLRDVETCRADDLVALLARLRPQASFERIAVAGLDADETATLVAGHALGDPTDGFIRHLVHATAGNPLFIGETLRSLSEADTPSRTGVVSERALVRIGVPEGAKEMIAQRILRLGATAREALATAAVIGTRFDLGVLEALLPASADELIAALEEAVGAGLVHEAEDEVDSFEFSHALVREALVEQHGASRRTRLHHRIGAALLATGAADPAVLAHHFYEGRTVDGGAQALLHALAAGEAATRSLAHEEAAGHYRRALAVLDMGAAPDEAQRCDVLLALGRVELREGNPAARATFAQAAELARRAGRPEQLARAALGFSGRHIEAGIVDEEAIALLQEALVAAGEDDSVLRARLTARLADTLRFARDPGETAALSLAALVMARRLGDTPTLVTALESRHAALLHIEHLDERLRLSEEFLALAADVGERELQAVGLHWRIYDLLEAADVAGAKQAHAQLATLADELRQPLYRHFAQLWEVVWAQMEGRALDSELLAAEAYELGRQAQARDAETVYDIQVIALRRREDLLSGYVATIEAALAKHPSLVAWSAVLPLAHLAAGDVPKAAAEFERLAADDFAGIPRDMFWFTAVSVLSESCALFGDEARAAVLYEMLLPFKERNVQVSQAAFWGSAERFLGLLAAATGRWDDAQAHFESAIAKDEAGGCPVAAGVVRRDYAEMLLARRAPGDVEAAVALLRAMLEAAAAAGMSVLADRLAERLQQVQREPA
ncbi:MAG: eukaryotic-like serine/threonine-protein kinase [Solirubrobacteraceae bacterium]|nr:eukaryotic-like serine/threonine-protein kinase [Solirubrobacteraceae bacterium]